jgi:hypothetical protein
MVAEEIKPKPHILKGKELGQVFQIYALLCQKGKYHGLYIELKVGNNKTSEHQDKWLQNLSRCGYAVKVCYGSTSAKQTIEKYLQLGD